MRLAGRLTAGWPVCGPSLARPTARCSDVKKSSFATYVRTSTYVHTYIHIRMVPHMEYRVYVLVRTYEGIGRHKQKKKEAEEEERLELSSTGEEKMLSLIHI